MGAELVAKDVRMGCVAETKKAKAGRELVSFDTRRIVAVVVMLLGSTLGGLLAVASRLAVGSHRWCSAWRGGGNGIHINLGESKRLTTCHRGVQDRRREDQEG